MNPKRVFVLIAVAVTAASIVVLMFRRPNAQPAPAATQEIQAPPAAVVPALAPVAPPPPVPPLPAKPAAAAPAAHETGVARLTEGQIMDRLHALAASDPATSLTLAREGNRRFRRSSDAPERASIIVRALSSMGRHDEARAEAAKMEKEYPKSEWTADVHRHMFVNPPDHPAERGHGKTLELE